MKKLGRIGIIIRKFETDISAFRPVIFHIIRFKRAFNQLIELSYPFTYLIIFSMAKMLNYFSLNSIKRIKSFQEISSRKITEKVKKVLKGFKTSPPMSEIELRSKNNLHQDYPPFFSVAKNDVDEQEELEKYDEQDHPYQEHHEQPFVIKIIRIVISLVISSIVLMLVFFPFIAVVSLIRVIMYPVSKSLKAAGFINGFLNPLLALIFCSANVIIVLICFSDEIKESQLHKMMIIKAMILFLSQILVAQYIRAIKIPSWKEDLFNCSSYLEHDKISDYVLQIFPKQSVTIQDFDLDIQHWLEEYSNRLKSMHLQISQQRFNTLFKKHKNPHSFEYRGFQFFINQNLPLQPQRIQFIIMALLAIAKTIFALSYISSHSGYGRMEFLLTIVLGIQTINVIFCIFKMVSNYDLRRKRMILDNLIGAINFCEPDINLFQKLDITSEISLDTWDNARRIVYDYFEEKQRLLEGCYFCFLFAYFFIILVFISAFNHEIEFLFQKDSIMLHPMIILSFLLDFILLSNIILARIFAGQQINNLFEDQMDAIDAVKGKIQDLLMKYDYYFSVRAISDSEFERIVRNQYDSNYKKKDTIQLQKANKNKKKKESDDETYDELVLQDERKISIYDLIAAKIRQNATHYIENQIEFQGQKYTSSTDHKLHISMMNNIVSCFDTIKEQIGKDQTQKDYKFLNIMHMEFTETLNTIVFGLISIIPAIIPDLKALFK